MDRNSPGQDNVLGKQNWSIRSVSEEAMLSHEAWRHFILNCTIKYFKPSVMVIGRGLFLSYLVKFIWGTEMICNLFPKFHARHEGLSFFSKKVRRRSWHRAIIIYNFCWPNIIQYTYWVTATSEKHRCWVNKRCHVIIDVFFWPPAAPQTDVRYGVFHPI